jgi:hypothetical protein
MKRFLIALAMIVASTAHAQFAFRGPGIKFDPGLASNCSTGTLCLYRNGNTLTLRTVSDTDSTIVLLDPSGLLLANRLERLTAGTLNIGTTTATSGQLGKSSTGNFSWNTTDAIVRSSGLNSFLVSDSGNLLTGALELESDPSATVSAAGRVKLRSNAGVLQVSQNGGAWGAISGGGGVDGLFGAYSAASSTSKNIITETAGLGPVIIRDVSGGSAGFFAAQTNAGVDLFTINGSTGISFFGTSARPLADNTYAFGATGLRWSSVATLGVTAGAGTLTLTSGSNAHTVPVGSGADTVALLAASQTLTNKTLTAPILSGTITGTYTIGGTPTIGATLGVGTDNSFSIGDATHRLATVFALKQDSGASTQTHTSSIATSGSAVAHSVEVSTAFTTGDRVLRFMTGVSPTERAYFEWNGSWLQFKGATATGPSIVNSQNDGLTTLNGGGQLQTGGVAKLSWTATTFNPTTDVSVAVGDSSHRYSEIWSRQHAGVEQTIAAAASITLNPASGETIRVTLSATAITTINGSAGKPGEIIRVVVIQDATGGRSISGWSTGANGFKLAGGSFTVSAGANAIDVLSFAWDNTTSKWVEIGRVLNES